MLEEKQYDSAMTVIKGIKQALRDELEVEYLLEVFKQLDVDFDKVDDAHFIACCRVLR